MNILRANYTYSGGGGAEKSATFKQYHKMQNGDV